MPQKVRLFRLPNELQRTRVSPYAITDSGHHRRQDNRRTQHFVLNDFEGERINQWVTVRG